jgi:hypothetical protein
MRSLRVAALAPVLFGCATISTSPGTGPVPRGIRIYPPRILLLVDGEYDGGKGRSTLLVLPNLAEAYDVLPVTVLARNEFRIDVEDGMLKSLQSGQDTTAPIALLKSAGETAARAAGVGVSARDFEGSYGLPTGVYLLKPDGTLAAVPAPQK